MKKTLLVVLTTLAVLLALNATAERRIWLYSHDGNHVSLPVEKLDSISFEEPGRIVLNPEKKLLDCSGGRFSLSIQANKAWTATVSDPTALTISKSSGTGNDNISVLAQSNADEKSYTSFVKFTLSDGTCKYLYVTVDGIIQSVSLDKNDMRIKIGNSEYLTATTYPAGGQITWSSSNKSVATVSNGLVTAVSEGEAIITAKSGSKSASCYVTVYDKNIPNVQPTAGMITIAFKAPEVSCDGLVINMFGDFQGFKPEDTSFEASVYDGTQWPGWYVVTFPDNEGSGTAKGKLCPQALGSGVGTWNYMAKDFEILEGPAERVVDIGTDVIQCNEGCVGSVIYVNVKQWSGDPCSPIFPSGDVAFSVILTNEFPEGFDISTIQIAVAHWDAGQDELTYDFTYTGGYRFVGTVADFPGSQQYKYNIQYTPEGGEPSGWIWEKGENRDVPYNGITEDEVAEWESEPWNPIPGGEGTFTITFSKSCNMAQYEKVIFTGNFAEESWGESQREMTDNGDGSFSWTGEFPDNFMYKVIGRTEGSDDAWIGPGDNWKFDGATFEQSWECQ